MQQIELVADNPSPPTEPEKGPFPCDECARGFSTKQGVAVHKIRTHRKRKWNSKPRTPVRPMGPTIQQLKWRKEKLKQRQLKARVKERARSAVLARQNQLREKLHGLDTQTPRERPEQPLMDNPFDNPVLFCPGCGKNLRPHHVANKLKDQNQGR